MSQADITLLIVSAYLLVLAGNDDSRTVIGWMVFCFVPVAVAIYGLYTVIN